MAGKITYRYNAKDAHGKTVTGVENAVDINALHNILLERDLYLQSAIRIGNPSRRKMMDSKTLSEFCQQLSTLLAAGVSLVKALAIISEEEGLNPTIKSIYEAILSDVRKGTALSDALEEQEVFPEIMLGMMRAGEGTGKLDEVCSRLSMHFIKEHQLKQQVKSALTYPIILGVLAIAVVIVIMTFVLPQFDSLFEGMDELPGVTLALMAFSDFLVTKWYIVVITVIFLIALSRILLSMSRIRLGLDKFKLTIPLFGDINSVICTARFSRTLSSLYSSGVPIIVALQSARDTVGNTYIASQFDAVLTKVRNGENLSAALSEVKGFRRKLFSTIQVGEETGKLDSMLNSVADSMEYDAQEATKRMMTLLEPILIVIMALIVGLIMIAVMLPIIQSYGSIEGSANL